MEIIRAHIKDGIVVNLSVGDTDKPWTPPSGETIVDLEEGSEVSIGWSYDGEEFSPPSLAPQPFDSVVSGRPAFSTSYQNMLDNKEKYLTIK